MTAGPESREARAELERRREEAARRDAVARARARGAGENLEEAIHLVRAGAEVHGVARR